MVVIAVSVGLATGGVGTCAVASVGTFAEPGVALAAASTKGAIGGATGAGASCVTSVDVGIGVGVVVIVIAGPGGWAGRRRGVTADGTTSGERCGRRIG